MLKKILIVTGILLLVLVILGGFFFSRQEKPVSPIPEKDKTPVSFPEKEELLLYEDEAGFSFSYPKILGIVEKEVDKPNVYSSLELLTKTKAGEKLQLEISDTSLTTVDQYLSKNPQEANLASVETVTLAGMAGKSLKYTNPSKNLILVIDSGILYYFEAPSDGDFWDKTLQTLNASFKFKEEKETSASAGNGQVVEEEEEIIQ